MDQDMKREEVSAWNPEWKSGFPYPVRKFQQNLKMFVFRDELIRNSFNKSRSSCNSNVIILMLQLSYVLHSTISLALKSARIILSGG